MANPTSSGEEYGRSHYSFSRIWCSLQPVIINVEQSRWINNVLWSGIVVQMLMLVKLTSLIMLDGIDDGAVGDSYSGVLLLLSIADVINTLQDVQAC